MSCAALGVTGAAEQGSRKEMTGRLPLEPVGTSSLVIEGEPSQPA